MQSATNIASIDIINDLRQCEIFDNVSDKTLRKYLPYFYYRSIKKISVCLCKEIPVIKFSFCWMAILCMNGLVEKEQ
jgi:hypothetical protein